MYNMTNINVVPIIQTCTYMYTNIYIQQLTNNETYKHIKHTIQHTNILFINDFCRISLSKKKKIISFLKFFNL